MRSACTFNELQRRQSARGRQRVAGSAWQCMGTAAAANVMVRPPPWRAGGQGLNTTCASSAWTTRAQPACNSTRRTCWRAPHCAVAGWRAGGEPWCLIEQEHDVQLLSTENAVCSASAARP